MKKVLVVMLVLAAVGLSSNRAEAQKFNDRSLNNKYSIVLSGWDISAENAPVSLSGVMQFNGKGGVVKGSISYNDGGTLCNFSDFGSASYTVKRDGTGTLTLILNTGTTTCVNPPITSLGLALSLFNNGRQANLSTQGITPNTAVLTGTLSLQKRIR
jgi:hypothetical protein